MANKPFNLQEELWAIFWVSVRNCIATSRQVRPVGLSTYVAAGLGGAVNGVIAASGGYWYGPAGGFVGGGVQSSVSQSANILNGSSNTFSPGDVFTSGVYQGAFGLLPGLRIKGVTADRYSFEAVGRNVLTRFDNGYINNIGIQTAGKIFTANVVRNSPSTVAQTYLSVPGNSQSLITTLTSLVSVLQSLVQFLTRK